MSSGLEVWAIIKTGLHFSRLNSESLTSSHWILDQHVISITHMHSHTHFSVMRRDRVTRGVWSHGVIMDHTVLWHTERERERGTWEV